MKRYTSQEMPEDKLVFIGDLASLYFELYNYVKNLLQRGIKEHVIKDLPIPLLTSFAFVPIITLLNFHFDGVLNMDENHINEACEIAWNAIKIIDY